MAVLLQSKSGPTGNDNPSKLVDFLDRAQEVSTPGRETTSVIFESVANALQDRADKWLSADKTHDIDEPPIRVARHLGTFSNIDHDLKRYNFGGAMKWLEKFQPRIAAEVNSKMDLLAKALNEAPFFFDPDLDPATRDPLARRLSEVSLFLRQVAKTIDAKQPAAGETEKCRDSMTKAEADKLDRELGNVEGEKDCGMETSKTIDTASKCQILFRAASPEGTAQLALDGEPRCLP